MIGIDIGKVIIGEDTQRPGLFFSERFREAPPVKSAFRAIEQLVDIYRKDNIYLVSRCSKKTEHTTRQWLDYHDVYEKTGILEEQVLFCRHKAEKNTICLDRDIRIFIDDRYTNMEHMTTLDKLYLFQPSTKELHKFRQSGNKNVLVVDSWEAILKDLL